MGLEKSVVIEKDFAVYYGCWTGGGLKQGLGVREPLTPPGNVGKQFSFSDLVCEASRITLYCSSAYLMGAFGDGGATPSHPGRVLSYGQGEVSCLLS